MNDINAFISQLQFIVSQNYQLRRPSYLNNEDKNNNSSPTKRFQRKRFENAFKMIVQTQMMINPVWINSVSNPTGIQMSVDQLESNPMILTMAGIQPNETNDFIHFYKEKLTENMLQNQKKRNELITKQGANKKPFNKDAAKIGNFLINDALQAAGMAVYQQDDQQSIFMFPFDESNQFDDNEQPNDDDDDDQSNTPNEEEDQNEIINHMKKQFFKNLENQHKAHENRTNHEHLIRHYPNPPKNIYKGENASENNENSVNTMHDCCYHSNPMPRNEPFHSSHYNCIQQNHNGVCKCCVENCINHSLPGCNYCLIHKCAVHGCDCQKEPLSLYCSNHQYLLGSHPQSRHFHSPNY